MIDEHGRLFGRFNLVDAALVVLTLAAIPLAYGAYLLFRDPAPRITEVVPAVFHQAANLQVEIHGEHLRPYMRVSFGNAQGRTFLFANPGTAVVQLPDLLPGKYDVVLYDYMQEVSRLPAALTIEAATTPPLVTIDIIGAFTALTPEQAGKLKAGYKLPEVGDVAATVTRVDPVEPEVARIRAGSTSLVIPVDGQHEVPAAIRTRCFLETGSDGILRCTVGGVPLAPDANVRFPGLVTGVNFRVREVHYPGRAQTAVVHVRFVVSAEARARIKAGDADIGAKAHPAGAPATLDSVTDRPDLAGASTRGADVRQPVATARPMTIDAVLHVPLEETPTGWKYKGEPVKVGAAFSFETLTYTMDGGVTDVLLTPQTPSAKTPASTR